MESVVKRNIAFDYLRVAACALVIGVHVSGQDWEAIVNSGSSYRIFSHIVYLPFFQIAVPIFVMISGANLLNPARHSSLKKIYFRFHCSDGLFK